MTEWTMLGCIMFPLGFFLLPHCNGSGIFLEDLKLEA